MRPSSTWFFYGLGLICLLLSVWLVLSPPADDAGSNSSAGEPSESKTTGDDPAGPVAGTAPTPIPNAGPAKPPSPTILPSPELPPAELVAGQRDAWIRKYCEQLAEYSYQTDMASLERLLAELGSAELKIAEAAYHNLMARHDPRAIPYLELRIAAASSAFEKKHLQELVDFLKTKSILDSDLSGKPGER